MMAKEKTAKKARHRRTAQGDESLSPIMSRKVFRAFLSAIRIDALASLEGRRHLQNRREGHDDSKS